ncbi:MAG: efflux RND transporter periplasmic adaptor subunit [Deltaproteobacteria bacterium]|nr:efflux RND transporter periplasmic adaptor subunit [Deltaproteobacteria bacterium]
MIKKVILGVFLVLLVGVGAFVYWGQYRRSTAALFYSGTIDAVQSDIAFLVSGRVAEIRVDEGQKIRAGQKLAVLEPDDFLARKARAQADLKKARANLERLQALLAVNRKVLPVEVERAEAAVAALKAKVRELETGYRFQEKEKARFALETAAARLDLARKEKARYDALYAKKAVSESAIDAVGLQFETALKAYQQARESLNLAEEGFRTEEIDAAKATLTEGKAALKLAKSKLATIVALEKEVKAARAQVEAARTALELAEIQLGYATLSAPFDGIVFSRNMEPGEVVTPGQEVLSVADLSRVDLKVFVNKTEIGKIRPGQSVDVKVDTFPDRTYSGTVTYVSPQAEFTPKIIQTQEERVKLVYRVKVRIPNPDLELKPGMPADAWFR